MMIPTVIVANFGNDKKIQSLFEGWQDEPYGVNIKIFQDLDEARIEMESELVRGLIFYSENDCKNLDLLIDSFRINVSFLTDFIWVLHDNPSPRFLLNVFEYGIENIYSINQSRLGFKDWIDSMKKILSDITSPEVSAINFSTGVKTGDFSLISSAENSVARWTDCNYKAAFIAGKIAEFKRDYTKAEYFYKISSETNSFFLPSRVSYAENKFLNGDHKEAIQLFEDMSEFNDRNISRDCLLVVAYLESDSVEKATKILTSAESLYEDHPKVWEMRTILLFSRGKIKQAFKCMDYLQDLGPFFIYRLKELCMKLVDLDKMRSALALLNKTHRHVRSDLKYQISLNAALICQYGGDYEKSYKYLARCSKEYGDDFCELAELQRHQLSQPNKIS